MASDLGDASVLEPPPVPPLETWAPSRKGNRKGGLPEAKRKGRAKRLNKDAEELLSSLQRLDLTTECTVPVGTGLVWDERMTEFRCLWDESFPECPERLVAIRGKLLQWDLLERCVLVTAQEISEEEILLAHSQEYLDLMKSTEAMSEAELKSLSDTYDSVYLHPNSYHCACLAAGSVLQLVEKVWSGELRNGLAVVRPPGHHAQRNKMDGYCMFNNVGIAAQYARQKLGVERVLIVDWDVHHGQGTQYLFEDNPSVLYFSIHRYEGGSFWPHLPESDSHAMGRGRGEGYNINVPWNQVGMRDADYLSAFLHILLPVALEFQPQLVLVAAGFDSVIGDPKGEMAATSACFAHLTHLLMPLSGGKVVLSLEGGYNLQSLAEGTCTVLKTLLGDPCPLLESPLAPCRSALRSVSRTLAAHGKHWKSLRRIGVDAPQQNGGEVRAALPSPRALPGAVILSRSATEPMRLRPASCTGLVYDEKMMEHYNMWDSQHPELPQRVSRIFQRHGELRLTERCSRLPARLASEEELRMCHSPAYVETVKSTAAMKPRDLHRQGDRYNSIYICASSYECARLAAGSAFSAVEAVLSGEVQNAVAIVRPPGHHAEPDVACGFCFFNSVALAARYAQRLARRPMRVLILDWDVHHGNGTQHMFEDDPSVLYVSLHRYDNGTFFPTSEDADYTRVGAGPGEGFTLNVPWNCPRMGDPEYLAAFHQIVMPVCYEFNPELVLVSAGFDAARGDPLGGCLVSPECYAHMTHMLLGLAGGKVAVVLEGGYNLESISESMTMCTRSLLGDPPPPLGRLKAPHPSALQSLARVAAVHRKYWACLRLEVPAPLWEKPRTRAAKGTPVPGEMPPEPPQELLRSPTAQPVEEMVDEAEAALGSLQLEDNPAEEGETASSSLSPDSSPVGQEARGCPEGAEPAEDPQRDGTSAGSSSGEVESPDNEAEVSPPDLSSTPNENHLLDEATGGFSPPGSSQKEEDLADGGQFYAVTPLPWCPHLDAVLPVPPTGLNVLESCAECGSKAENWVCLVCYKVCCGRYINQHMVAHNSESGHPLVLSFADLSAWCYECQAYIHHQILFEAKSQAHKVKFGVDMMIPAHKENSLDLPPTPTENHLLDEATGGSSPPGSSQKEEDLADGGQFYAVTPLPWCPHLDAVLPVPPTGLNVLESCAECGSKAENWVCLVCYKVCCGRYINQHMVAHNSESGHPLVLSFADLSAWCYECQAYIHHQTLFEAKSQAHKVKFGVDMMISA
ncbi:histone deacetylase 6 isoform X2 [Elgaria multicarinata webbii]|uniref:histone deacetylase 6 isoform X2 n=1 Tax=Elgaria multicarinata webbii TaxID=159646 RepID=UPI002FCD1BAA